MERLQYVSLTDNGGLVVQLDGGGATAYLPRNSRADDVVGELRRLADLLEASVEVRASRNNLVNHKGEGR